MELDATAKFSGYSLWLLPDEPSIRQLSATIEQCAENLDTPVFSPHMTLLGGVPGLTLEDAKAKMQQLVNAIHAVEMDVVTVTYKESLYYQCVFALFELSSELVHMNETARGIFGRQEDPPFMPHVSLVYGDLPTETRKQVAEELAPRFQGRSMQMRKLQLWDTNGKLDEWKLVSEYDLTQA